MPYAFAATVALLVWMGFFMMGSLPLLILKHDTPVDARFIRGLFNVYYWAVIVTAALASAAFSLAGMPPFALLMGGIAVLAVATRHKVIVHMDLLRAAMTTTDAPRIARFRRLHVAGMLLNVLQLGCVVAAITQLRL
jgi:hypothetical protein